MHMTKLLVIKWDNLAFLFLIVQVMPRSLVCLLRYTASWNSSYCTIILFQHSAHCIVLPCKGYKNIKKWLRHLIIVSLIHLTVDANMYRWTRVRNMYQYTLFMFIAYFIFHAWRKIMANLLPNILLRDKCIKRTFYIFALLRCI